MDYSFENGKITDIVLSSESTAFHTIGISEHMIVLSWNLYICILCLEKSTGRGVLIAYALTVCTFYRSSLAGQAFLIFVSGSTVLVPKTSKANETLKTNGRRNGTDWSIRHFTRATSFCYVTESLWLLYRCVLRVSSPGA